MAESLSKDVKTKAATEAVTGHFSDLVRSIDPLMVSADLFSKKIIDKATLDRINSITSTTKAQKSYDVLTSVLEAVGTNPEAFNSFCDVLEREPLTSERAKCIKGDYESFLEKATQSEPQSMCTATKLDNQHKPSTSKCDCSTLQASFLVQLKKQLEGMLEVDCNETNEEQAQLSMIKTSVKNYITKYVLAGCVSVDHLKEHLLTLHKEDNLISNPAVYKWAIDFTSEAFSKFECDQASAVNPTSPAREKKPPLFSKPVLYHAGICALAVCNSDAGDYLKFFKNKELVPGHSFKEVSISRSKQDRYLIATQDDSTYYIAFQSEPDVTEWPKKYKSFDEGISRQAEKVPIRFIVELLSNEKNRIVLTGFSYGGLLACSIMAQVWHSPYISSHHLQKNLVCITFAQPHLPVPQLADIARECPEIASTIHAIYYEEDLVPRLVKYLDLPCSTLVKKTAEVGLQMKIKEQPRQPFQDPLTLTLIKQFGSILRPVPQAASAQSAQFIELKDLLDRLSENIANGNIQQSVTYHTLSFPTGKSGLTFGRMSQDQVATYTSYPKPADPSFPQSDTELASKHSMQVYSKKLYRSYLEKDPEYKIPPLPKTPAPFSLLKPSVSALKIHEHGSEVALVLEGKNLWFCNQLSVCGNGISTPPSNISGMSIQVNCDRKSNVGSLQDGENVKVTLQTCFFRPSSFDVTLQKREYPINVRQQQLARLTPSGVIELAYLSALLEQHPHGDFQALSHKVIVIKTFLEQVVRVVPLESIGFAIGYGNEYVAEQCAKAVEKYLADMPGSQLMTDAIKLASDRLDSGISPDIVKSLVDDLKYSLPDQVGESQYGMRRDKSMLSVHLSRGDAKADKVYSWDDLKLEFNAVPSRDLSSDDLKLDLRESYTKNYVNIHHSSKVCPVVCGLSIDSLYSVTGSDHLKSPTGTLQSGKEKLTSLSMGTTTADSEPLQVGQTHPSRQRRLSFLDNSLMLQVVNEIRQRELAICVSLLAGFMEQHEIEIPLMKSEKDHSKALNLSARASVGVWALSSLDFEHIQPILGQCHGEQLLVKIEDYVKGIVNARSMAPPPDDTQYAAKLQFIVQGVHTTVTCNSQYISYSLERQLAVLCKERNITESIPLDKLTTQWDLRFQKNILSLVARSHRPLIACWIKWALMVHNLREELAKYTAVGVIGLVNSGKSRLVNSLFGIEIPSGTTEEKRTTVPFMYNLNDKVEGLDVVDFPGVDDRDESISDLADLLLTLAQIIIFVVDYRKIHTESGKKWLERLQVENVPVLVCLTYADKLYAEHMTDDGQYPDKRFMKQELQTQLKMIQEKLNLPTSHQIKFCSFSQDKDSVLNKKEGRDKLKSVGIDTPSEVGDWLVETFKKRFGQDELAERLSEFIHSEC